MKKEQIQETIQKSFEQECRGYAFYTEAYNLMQAQLEDIEDEIEDSEKNKETIIKVEKLKAFLNSKERTEIEEKLQCKITDEFKKAVLEFLDNGTRSFEEMEQSLEKLYKQEKELRNLRDDKKIALRRIRTNIIRIISYVAEYDMKLVVTKEISDVAYKAFVEYYKDTSNFMHNKHIIDIENSNLPEEFMKAYLSAGYNMIEMKQALEWFEQEAKKINF